MILSGAADELRAIACLGLRFLENPYDRERYEHILNASARMIDVLEDRSSSEILSQFQDNLLHVSPLAGAEAAVFQDGKVLLIQRSDNQLWALPGGLAEVGETLVEAAQRELREETGIHAQMTQPLVVFVSRLWQSKSKAQLYHVIFLAEPDGEVSPSFGLETVDIGFFDADHLPEFAPGHHLRVPFCLK